MARGRGAVGRAERLTRGSPLLDIDNDRDLDLVLTADKAAADRHSQRSAGPVPRSGAFKGLPSVEHESRESWRPIRLRRPHRPGRAPCSNGRVLAWRNTTERTTAKQTKLTFESWPINAANWRAAQAIDLDLDGLPDLLGLPAAVEQAGRTRSCRPGRATKGIASRPRPCRCGLASPGLDGLTAVDLVGDPLPDILVIRPGEPPALSPRTWATDSTGWRSSSAGTGGSSPS